MEMNKLGDLKELINDIGAIDERRAYKKSVSLVAGWLGCEADHPKLPELIKDEILTLLIDGGRQFLLDRLRNGESSFKPYEKQAYLAMFGELINLGANKADLSKV